MSATATAAKVATAATAIALPAAAMGADDIIWTVILPLVAAWAGLAGVGISEEQPMRVILRSTVASVLLGGVAGLVALALIEQFDLAGYRAAFISLLTGISTITITKQMRRAGGSLIDPLLAALGLRRADNDEGND